MLELNLNNIQFTGDSEMQKQFCIAKFLYVLNTFTNLETLNMQSVYDAPQVFKNLSRIQNKGYADSLTTLNINACILKEESKEGGWVVE